MNQKTIYRVFQRFQAQNPHPTTELAYRCDFELLIAVMLSAQATDLSVNKATQSLFAVANSPEAILALGEAALKQHIKSIGLFNSKARHIMQTCQILVALHHSKVPANRSALEALPGVGRKTANVVLNTLFGQPTIAVDTHVFRVANRSGMATGSTPLLVERSLEKKIPPGFLRHAHLWLVIHGRYVCTAKKPQCKTCIIRDLCEYEDKR